MTITNISNLRKNLSSYFVDVIEYDDTITVTTKNVNAVIISETEYNSILDRVIDAYPDAEIEEKKYSPSYYIEFKANQMDLRKNIVLRIQNDLRRENINLDDFDSIRYYSRNLFSYNFDTEEERDGFKLVFESNKVVISKYVHFVGKGFE